MKNSKLKGLFDLVDMNHFLQNNQTCMRNTIEYAPLLTKCLLEAVKQDVDAFQYDGERRLCTICLKEGKTRLIHFEEGNE